MVLVMTTRNWASLVISSISFVAAQEGVARPLCGDYRLPVPSFNSAFGSHPLPCGITGFAFREEEEWKRRDGLLARPQNQNAVLVLGETLLPSSSSSQVHEPRAG
jgi:hypothetical protein